MLDEGSRLVSVLGLGGIGKSLLATRLAHDFAPSFERVFWRSLRDAPTPGEWLADVLRFLAPEAASESSGEAALPSSAQSMGWLESGMPVLSTRPVGGSVKIGLPIASSTGVPSGFS